MGTRDRGNQEATVFVGDLDEQVDEALLWELMLQCAPVGTGRPRRRHRAEC